MSHEPCLSVDRARHIVTFHFPVAKSIFNLGNNTIKHGINSARNVCHYENYVKDERKYSVNPFTIPMKNITEPLIQSIGRILILDDWDTISISLFAYFVQGLQLTLNTLKDRKSPTYTGLEGILLHLPHRDRAALICTCTDWAHHSSDFEARMKMFRSIICSSKLFLHKFVFHSGEEMLQALEYYVWRNGEVSYAEFTSFRVPEQPAEPPPKKRKYRRLDGNVKRAKQ